MKASSPFLFAVILAMVILSGRGETFAAHETGEFVLTAPKGATYTLIVPDSYDRRRGATLLFWLHGAGDNHANAARALKSRRFKPDWILAIPDATANGSWQADEMDRVMDVLDQVEKNYTIRRAFMGGFSRGGFFTFQFGLQHTDRFAGYLCVSGGLPGAGLVKKEDAGKFAVAIVHGEADTVVPYDSGVKARDAFKEAGWKDKLFWRSVPGLGHRIDAEAVQAALDWLDENAQVLKTPKDYYEYGMKLNARGELGRAYWILSQIEEAEAGDFDWWSKVEKTLGKIEKAAEKEGKKVMRAIEKDRNAKWLPDWAAFHGKFEGVPYDAEVQAAYAACVERQNLAAEEFLSLAETAKAAGETKDAIEACLKIRDECYVADSEAVKKAKDILAEYRADEDVARRFRRYLRDTEDWK